MRLTELEPQFLRRIDDLHFEAKDALSEADGITFVCPKCMLENDMKRPGCHSIICWAPTVPQTTSPTPGRWEMLGGSYDDLTLRAGSSSILLTGPGCGAHFFIESGNVRMC